MRRPRHDRITAPAVIPAPVESIAALLRVGLAPSGDDISAATAALQSTPQILVGALDPTAPTVVKQAAARALLLGNFDGVDEPACILIAQAICRTAGLDYAVSTAPPSEHQLIASCRPTD